MSPFGRRSTLVALLYNYCLFLSITWLCLQQPHGSHVSCFVRGEETANTNNGGDNGADADVAAEVLADAEKRAAEGAGMTPEQAAEEEAKKKKAEEEAEQLRLKKEEARKKLLDEKADWGTFYDPKDIFCGKFDCYKILGFDHETFYSNPPDKKEITQAYRALSRAWHPDKNPSKKAKERFVKISRAYEVLTNKDTREEYDYLRERPDEYFEKYGSSVLWTYAPKSDVRFIIFILLALSSLFSVYVKKQRWKQVADHVIKAAVDGLGLKEGGSTESIEIRKKALELQAERQAAAAKKQKEEAAAAGASNGASTENGNSKKKTSGGKSGFKQTPKEKKKAAQEELRAIIVELVNEIDDFGGGYAKPTVWDMFVVQLALFPLNMGRSMSWWLKFFVRRRRGLEYNDEELERLTRNAVGEAGWDCASAEEKEEMKTKELWIKENLDEWKEELETRNLSSGEQKRYRRMKKKEGTKLE